MIARVYLCSFLVCVLFLLCPLTSFALPAQVEADRYLLAAKQKIDEQNYSASKRYFEKIIALEGSIDIPDKFYYHYGRVLNKTGDYDKAYRQLEIYLNGQDRTFYKEALNQLTVAEEKSEQAKKQAMISDMVFVKGGCFQMGAWIRNGQSNEYPLHEVCVDSFSIGKYEVTQAQWQAAMGDNPSEFKGKDRPVETVNWNDMQKFLQKINQYTGKNYRLPTEAEWEYAARSGGKKELFAGASKFTGSRDKDLLAEYAWHKDNSGGTTHSIGQLKPNGLGLYDMSGNVLEMCQDAYDEGYYDKSPKKNPCSVSDGHGHVARGSGWFSSTSTWWYGTNTVRAPYSDWFRSKYLGFRMVLPVGR